MSVTESHVNIVGDEIHISISGEIKYISPLAFVRDSYIPYIVIPFDSVKNLHKNPESYVEILEDSSWSYREDSRGIDVHEDYRKLPAIKIAIFETNEEIVTVFIAARKLPSYFEEYGIRKITIIENKENK